MTAALSPEALAARMHEVLNRHLEEALVDVPEVAGLIRSYLDRPAKLIRPTLLAEAARAYGARNEEAVLDLAAGTELLHLFALLHDDRIDGIDRNNLRIAEGSADAALRVLAGDLVHTIADGHLAETVIRNGLPLEVIRTVRDISAITVAGQARNMRFLRGEPTRTALYELYDMKTGYYSFVAPLRIGALSADADGGAALDRLGLRIGRAFQLADDAEDVDALRTDAAVEVPRWEFNLVAVYLGETQPPQHARRALSALLEGAGAGAGSEARDARAGIDLSGLANWVAARLSELRGEIRQCTAELDLPAAGRERLSAFLGHLLDGLGGETGGAARSPSPPASE